MKLSLSDPDWMRWQPYLDGVLLDNCIAADEEAGTVVVFENGWEPGLATRPTRLLRGHVELRPVR